MKLGFTGSQSLLEVRRADLENALQELLSRYSIDEIVTGACIGYDAAIQMWFAKNFPNISRTVIVPANRSKVDNACLTDAAARIIKMPANTSYRDRNQQIVMHSDRVASFWTGKRAYSGTYMTMNIARRTGILFAEDIFGAGELTDEEARFLFFNGDPS